jgi:hypothetical protein
MKTLGPIREGPLHRPSGDSKPRQTGATLKRVQNLNIFLFLTTTKANKMASVAARSASQSLRRSLAKAARPVAQSAKYSMLARAVAPRAMAASKVAPAVHVRSSLTLA